MKFKKLLILIIVVSLLLVLALIKNSAQKKQIIQEEITAVQPCVLTRDLATGFIQKVTIYKGDAEKDKVILLKNSDNSWKMENKFGVKAKKENVENLLQDLSGLKGELRAESKSVFGDFSLEDTQGIHITLEAEGAKPLAHIIVSPQRPGGDTSFLRLKDSEKIILAPKDILGRLNIYGPEAKLDSNSFADFKLLSLDTKKIEKIKTSRKGKNVFTLVKKKESDAKYNWDFEPAAKRTEIDPAKIDDLLRNISNIFAQDILDPSLTGYGFGQDNFSLLLETDEKKTIALEVGNYLEKEKSYYVKIAPGNQVFKVPEYAIQNIKKDKNYFLKEKIPVKK